MKQIRIRAENNDINKNQYYSFEITYFEDGIADLMMFMGKLPGKTMLISENKIIDHKQISKISNQLSMFRPLKNQDPNVANETKQITIYQNYQARKVDIQANDLHGLELFNECVALYDPMIESRMEHFVDK
ncbi:MAG: hypothetical protein ACFCUU_09145 [Cyclobacteriaceae bacterium]